MGIITRSTKGGVDTDGDGTEDVRFSVTPEDGVTRSYAHPAKVTYNVDVENLRDDETISFYEQVDTSSGRPVLVPLAPTAAPGNRITIATIALEHDAVHNDGSVVALQASQLFVVKVGAAYHDHRVDVRHDCLGQGAALESPEQQVRRK